MDAAKSKDDLLKLMKDKDTIEAEIKTLLDYLRNQGVGMDAALVDQDGFPRSDVDIPAVRTARNRIVCLRNDHKAVMDAIEHALAQYHAELKERQAEGGTPMDSDVAGGERTGASTGTEKGTETSGFARVSQVDGGSPASEGELRVEDVVTRFGSVTTRNFSSLQQLAEVVQHSVDSCVQLEVLRRDANGQWLPIRLVVKPRKWAGKGMLGAKFDPIAASKRDEHAK